MSLQLGVVLGFLGFGSGIVSGMLGISGAVLMVPLLLYVPPLLGVGELEIKTVAAVAIVQSLFASSSGIIAHGRTGYVNRRIAVIGGTLMSTGALTGGVLSKWAPETSLLAVFAILATGALILMAVPGAATARTEVGYHFRRPWRLGIFLPGGLLSGLVGVGGGFITVPILHRIMGVPIRTTMGSALAITWFGAMAGFLGKATTGQVPLWVSAAVVLGAVPGAQLGALVNHHIRGPHLRYLFIAVVAVVAVRMWLEVLARMGVG